MKILIIGGTRFLGRHLVEAAIARDHEVTLFNRGKTNPDIYSDLETIIGDRDVDLDRLVGHLWDAVIDTCGYFPRIVRASAQALANLSEHYTFISSISVYADQSDPEIDEDSPVGVIEGVIVEEITGETYGPLKALCEKEVLSAFPIGALIIRPGLIVGPHDPSDRFTYWPVRMSRGGEVLAPGEPRMPVQIIDARDLAMWIIALVELKAVGVFNATGPYESLTMQEIVDTCQRVTGVASRITWVEEEFLLGKGVVPFTEVPLWLPKSEWGMAQVNISRAFNAGLEFRALDQTVADTLVWAQSRPADRVWTNGLKPEREAELLTAWRKENK